jgi:hypothetical protein
MQRAVHVLPSMMCMCDQDMNAQHRGVSGIALTSMHQGLAAWTFGHDRGLVCTDLVTNQIRHRKHNTLLFISP